MYDRYSGLEKIGSIIGRIPSGDLIVNKLTIKNTLSLKNDIFSYKLFFSKAEVNTCISV